MKYMRAGLRHYGYSLITFWLIIPVIIIITIVIIIIFLNNNNNNNIKSNISNKSTVVKKVSTTTTNQKFQSQETNRFAPELKLNPTDDLSTDPPHFSVIISLISALQ